MRKRWIAILLMAAMGRAHSQNADVSHVSVPNNLQVTLFADRAVTPCVACLAVAPTGEVFAGLDQIGSLGKGGGRGRIVRLVDRDQDGVADEHTVFATLDNPRGLLPVGDQLYVLHTRWADESQFDGMFLSVLTDADGDGVADGPPRPLVREIGNRKYNGERGVDHTTNGIRMGIDGWIYIAAGDFGFVDATGTDGRQLTLFGGGIVRVRPDGTELELFAHGLRNIYDIAIDPFMNLFTRGNTNDGDGWNIRFIHDIQSGEFGYPTLFKRYTEEILPALADLGGGSGTGALFFSEPGWPPEYTDVPLMGDWGRGQLFIHRLTPDGPSFTQSEEPFVMCSKITDLDCDGSGRLYLGSWHGSGYEGGDGGFVARVTPPGWSYQPFPDLKALADDDLVRLLSSASAKTRLHVQQELLRRGASAERARGVAIMVRNRSASTASRVAALFTLKQLLGTRSHPSLLQFARDPVLAEQALRALADRRSEVGDVPLKPLAMALGSADPRVQVAAAVGLGRLGQSKAAVALLAVSRPPVPHSLSAPGLALPDAHLEAEPDEASESVPEGPHATPNSQVILPHVAVRSLVSLNAIDACLKALKGPQYQGALWALQSMHDPRTVDGLITLLDLAPDGEGKQRIARTLIRLAHKERAYDGSTWWGTRPDTRGPYYFPTEWEQTERIRSALVAALDGTSEETRRVILELARKDRLELDDPASVAARTAQAGQPASPEPSEPELDLDAISNLKGQVGQMSVEDVILALPKLESDPSKGPMLLVLQGCVACHSTDSSLPLKGPYLGQVGAILTPEQIALSILRPDAEIAQGFRTVQITLNSGEVHTGFVSRRESDRIDLRNIVGQVTVLRPTDIAQETMLPNSMMTTGLANGLSLEEFASLVRYLAQQKG